MTLFSNGKGKEQLVGALSDGTADLLDFVEADIDALRKDLDLLEQIQKKLEGLEKEESDLYADDLSEAELDSLVERLRFVSDTFDELQELEHEVVEREGVEQTKLRQAQQNLADLRELYS